MCKKKCDLGGKKNEDQILSNLYSLCYKCEKLDKQDSFIICEKYLKTDINKKLVKLK